MSDTDTWSLGVNIPKSHSRSQKKWKPWLLGTSFKICRESIESMRKGEAHQLVTLSSHSCAITHARVIAHTDERWRQHRRPYGVSKTAMDLRSVKDDVFGLSRYLFVVTLVVFRRQRQHSQQNCTLLTQQGSDGSTRLECWTLSVWKQESRRSHLDLFHWINTAVRVLLFSLVHLHLPPGTSLRIFKPKPF